MTLMPLRIRSMIAPGLLTAGLAVCLVLLIEGGCAFRCLAQAEDIPPMPASQPDKIPGRTERVEEEQDMFRERSKIQARAEHAASRNRKKKKAATFSSFFSLNASEPAEIGDGWGTIGRAGHLGFKTFGRNQSITPVEVMPYMLTDEHFVFADVRGFTSNSAQFGGNAGLGYRYLREDINAWGGASIWYDADQTSGQLFQQVGLSFEALIHRLEMRSNVYLPTTSAQTFSNTIGNEHIVGNQLLYGRSIDQGTALRGVDAEIGYSLPIPDGHQVRGFVGGYHFDGGSGSAVNGFKARAEGVFNNGVTAHVLYTNDQLYGSNVMVGCSLQFPFGKNHPTSGWKQNTPSPFRFVERNYNVIVRHQANNAGEQVAINPLTNQPYKIEQVSENGSPIQNFNPAGINIAVPGGMQVAVSGDGTTAHPYNYISSALAAGGDVIYVRSGSIINETVTLAAGQHLIGDNGSSHALAIAGGGVVHLPSLMQAAQLGSGNQTPRFAVVNGTAVNLASNTEVTGFVFQGIQGNAIEGTNVSGVSLHDLTFNDIGQDAIHLANSSGSVTMSDIQVNSAGGNGIVLDGGTANITYYGAGNTITAQADGFVLKNLTGGTVGLSNLSVKNTGGAGLRIDNVGTDVTIQSLSATQTMGPAVAISGTTGTVQNLNGVSTNVYNSYNFTGNTTITSPKGAGFTVNGTDALINVANLSVTSSASSPAISLVNATSAITIGSMNVNTTNATGLYGRGLGTLQVNGGSISTVNAGAVDIQGSAINTKFGSISVNGGPFGISLVQSTGVFSVVGGGNYGTGGTIQNTNTGLIIQSFGNASLNWVDFTTNGVGVQSNKASQLNLANVRITSSTGYAIDSMDDAVLTLSNSLLQTNGALGGGTVRIQADTLGTFQSQIVNNVIIDANGTAVQYLTTPSGAGASLATTIQSNNIAGTRGSSPVIGMNWNGPASVRISTNTIAATGAGMTGILLQDSSATDAINAQIDGNAFTFTGSQGTGLSAIASGPSTFTVRGNTFDFKATGGIGTRFAMNGTSTAWFASNIITDEAGGATGMLFDHVAASSRLQIEGNTINLRSTDLTVHQGIVFTAVDPTIQFSGNYNNLIYNTTTPFSIPVNASTGGFLINGIRVP
jgi:hypothetical protein